MTTTRVWVRIGRQDHEGRNVGLEGAAEDASATVANVSCCDLRITPRILRVVMVHILVVPGDLVFVN